MRLKAGMTIENIYAFVKADGILDIYRNSDISSLLKPVHQKYISPFRILLLA
jgi:hypothetical protein